MKVLIIGATGMLGNTLYRFFAGSSDVEVFGTIRSENDKDYFLEEFKKGLITLPDVLDDISVSLLISKILPDVVINCVGIVKQVQSVNDAATCIEINSLLPHRLKKICINYGARLIQISTDCVFAGEKGMYKEDDTPDSFDIYGRSKLLGEVYDESAITLRTSIIGHEVKSSHSLVDWFLSQNSAVKGFRNAIFSGLPAVEIGRIIKKYVLFQSDLKGLFHLSSAPISKFDLLRLVANEYGKKIEVIEDDCLKIDRSLDSSKFREITGFTPKSWPELVHSMHKFG